MQTKSLVSVCEALDVAARVAGVALPTVPKVARVKARRVAGVAANSPLMVAARAAGLVPSLPAVKATAKAKRRAAVQRGAAEAAAVVRAANLATRLARALEYGERAAEVVTLGAKAKARKARGGIKFAPLPTLAEAMADGRELARVRREVLPYVVKGFDAATGASAAELVRGSSPVLVGVVKAADGSARLDTLELSGRVGHSLTSSATLEGNAAREARELAELCNGADKSLAEEAAARAAEDKLASHSAADGARERVLLAGRKSQGRAAAILRASQVIGSPLAAARAAEFRARLEVLAKAGNASAARLLSGETDAAAWKSFLRQHDKERAAAEVATGKLREAADAARSSAARVREARESAEAARFARGGVVARFHSWRDGEFVWQRAFAGLVIGASGKAIRRVTNGARSRKLDGIKPAKHGATMRRVGVLKGEGWNTAGRVSAARVVTTDGAGDGRDWRGAATATGGCLVVSDASREEAHAAAAAAIAARAAKVAARVARRASGYWCADNDRDGQAAEVEAVLVQKFATRLDARGYSRGRAWYRAADGAASRAVSSLGGGLTGTQGSVKGAKVARVPVSVSGVGCPSEWGKVTSAFQPPAFEVWREANAEAVNGALRLLWARIVAPSRVALRKASKAAEFNARQSYEKNKRAFRILWRLLARGESLHTAAAAEGAAALSRLESGTHGKARETWAAIVAAACAPREGREGKESVAGVAAAFLCA